MNHLLDLQTTGRTPSITFYLLRITNYVPGWVLIDPQESTVESPKEKMNLIIEKPSSYFNGIGKKKTF